MPVLRTVMMALRVETPHLVRLLRPMVVEVAAVGKVLLLQVLAAVEVASVQKA